MCKLNTFTVFFKSIFSVLCLSVAGLGIADTVISGVFNLVDHHGKPVSTQSYEGRFRLVFFGFTDCPIVCPTTMVDVARVMRLLGDKQALVQPLFITIDPGRDGSERLASYVKAFHPSIVGLSGSPEQIKAAAKGFGVTFGGTSEVERDQNIEIFHSTYIYLMGPDGGFIDIFGFGTKPEVMTESLLKYISE